MAAECYRTVTARGSFERNLAPRWGSCGSHLDLRHLVVPERHATGEVEMLFVGCLVAPHRVFQLLAAGTDAEVSGSALERADRGGIRRHEFVHLHVRAREVETRRALVFVHTN